MKRDIQQALNEVEMTYVDLNDIAVNMTEEIFKPINEIINSIDSSTFLGSLDAIRTSLLKLSIQSFSLAEIKDKASLKQECAETIRKVKYAEQFNCSDGSVALRENTALINSSEETLTELVYNLVSALIKTKLDETHRIIDTLKTIVMSRMQEMKMTQNISIGEPGEKTYLGE